jgi:hypothetical protein
MKNEKVVKFNREKKIIRPFDFTSLLLEGISQGKV